MTGTNYAYPDNKASQLAEAPSPQLVVIHQRFTDATNRLRSLLNNLDDKLNKVHNKRVPEKEAAQEASMPNDALQALHDEAGKFNYQNDRLEKMLSHFSEII